ncbi:MAG: lipocalin-like domain-containing protein [Rhodothermales bacterium]
MTEVLSADTSGFARVVSPRPFAFPDDHGPHPSYRTEWWYYTGNLSAPTGRRFGYQFTVFRTALSPPEPDSLHDATWSTRQLFMAHFALSDVDDDAFYAFERFSRGAGGLAGAEASPYHVWLEDWDVAGQTADSVRLRARADGPPSVSVNLSLRRLKPVVPQGEGGLDRKGPEPGNASYYYSMTRMVTEGTVTVDADSFEVAGLSWLDREWSTSALGPDQIGWDWFSLQLDDGRDLMFYRLRQTDGTASPYSNGVVVASDGAVRRLEVEDVELEPLRYWESPATGARYPVEWAVRVPSLSIDLRIAPVLDRQELNHTVTYWEGAVDVDGSHTGRGYVEMTGYSEAVDVHRGG